MRAVSCIFHSYFDIIKNEIKKISPYYMQNSISNCLDSPIPKEDTGQAKLEFLKCHRFTRGYLVCPAWQ